MKDEMKRKEHEKKLDAEFKVKQNDLKEREKKATKHAENIAKKEEDKKNAPPKVPKAPKEKTPAETKAKIEKPHMPAKTKVDKHVSKPVSAAKPTKAMKTPKAAALQPLNLPANTAPPPVAPEQPLPAL